MKKLTIMLLMHLFYSSGLLMAQSTLTGLVKDENTNEPIPGVSVVLRGKTVGTITDVDGRFTLSASPEDVLIFSFIGYLSKEVPVGNKTTFTVSVSEDVKLLSEVVVVGYGTQKKSDLTGSVVSVSSKDFENQPIVRVDQALQGRSAGVQVTQTSGAPGAGFKIRVRGVNSISGANDPLYVVDGLVVGSINSINVNDVKSMEVLKDASATAIYGSRGANGVVLVTTKSGRRSQGVKVTYDAFFGSSKIPTRLDIMNGADFAETVNISDDDEVFTEAEIAELRANGGEDWQERIFQTGGFASHQIALSGGSEQVDYYISGNYYTQTGAIVDQTYDRYAIRAKLNANPTKKLGLGFNIYGSYEERVGARANVGNAVTFDPATSAFDENGEYNFTSLKNVATGALNPLVTARNNTNERFDDQLIASGYFSYDLAEGLELHVSGGLELLNRSQNNYTPILVNSIGSATVRSGEVSRLQNTNRLTYKKEFGQHGLQIDAIHEQQAITRDSVIATASGFFSDNTTYKNLSLGAIQNTGTAIANEGLQSFAGRVNYSFANRFLLTGTLRVDGSSKFPNDPWGVFPSGSFAWKISEETFMENVRQIDNLKLRVSHGITGSQAIGAFASVPIPLVDNNLNYPFEGEALTVGFAPPNRRASPDLTWEQTAQTNLGLDVGLWTSKVSFSADYYYKKTSDLLLLVTSSEFLGANIINRNVGEVENRGFEVALSLTPIETNDFSINSIISFSKNDNKVLSLVDGTPIELGQEYITNTFPVNPTRVEVGLPISSFRGYIFEGVYQLGEEDEAASFGREVGDAKYRDINGDGNITTDDITAIGDGNADFTWGWNTTISYKGLSLNFLVLGSQGNDVYNFTKGRQLSLGAQTFHAVHVDEKNKWTPENPSNIPKRRTGTHLLSSQFLEDGSFIRLKNLSVSYTFGKNDLLKNVDFIESLRLYTTADNLFIITDYSGFDPEATASGNSDTDLGIDWNAYPLTRSFTIGLNATF